MNDDIFDLVEPPSGWNVRAEAVSIARAGGVVPYRVLVLGPEAASDEYASKVAWFGGREAYARHQALLALHESGIGAEMSGLRSQMRHLGRLLSERVERKTGGDWLNSAETARLLGVTLKALYCRIESDPTGPLALASSRLGRHLRFSKSGLDQLLRKGTRPVPMRGRASSPVSKKENGR